MALYAPCPFCGFKDIGGEHCEMDEAQGTKWGGVVCPSCEARGPLVRTNYYAFGPWIDEALAEWDKREGGQ